MSTSVQIGPIEVRRIEYRGQQVVTFAMIDKVHGRKEGVAKDNFHGNRARFVESEDFIELGRGEISTDLPKGVFSKFAAKGVLITRRGYLKIVKSLNDDPSSRFSSRSALSFMCFRRLPGMSRSTRRRLARPAVTRSI